MINDILSTIQNNVKIDNIDNLTTIRELNKPIVNYSSEMKSKVDSVRFFLFEKMYNHKSVNKMSKNAEKVITFLYKFLISADKKIYDNLGFDVNKEVSPRIICDFIAGMTDNYAQSIYNKYS